MASSRAEVYEALTSHMAALPCPPLPIVFNTGGAPATAADDYGDDDGRPPPKTSGSSHDVLAHYLLLAMLARDPLADARRRARQEAATERLRAALLAGRGDADEAYHHFCHFTADYLCAFADGSVGLRFLPLEDVAPGDHVHTAASGWSAGQDRIYARADRRTTAEYAAAAPYAAMLLRAAQRVRDDHGAGGTPTPL